MKMIDATSTCLICQESVTMKVNPEDYARWEAGELIQVAMPYLSEGEREFLISGFCEPCFDAMFGEDEASID